MKRLKLHEDYWLFGGLAHKLTSSKDLDNNKLLRIFYLSNEIALSKDETFKTS